MKKILKTLLASFLSVLLCSVVIIFVSADAETEFFSLSDVTENMLADIGGIPTFVIESDKKVELSCDGTHNFAVQISSPHTYIRLKPKADVPMITPESMDITSILALNVTGDLDISGGDLLIRGDDISLRLTDSIANFSNCRITAKSLKSTGAILNNSTVTFSDGGRLTITGANTGVLSENSSVIDVVNGGVFKAYSVHSAAVRLIDKSIFNISDGKVFLGGHLIAVSGKADISDNALIYGDMYHESSAFIVTSGQKINISIDPGHGGNDPGAVYAAQKYPSGGSSYNFYLEKNLNLNTAVYLKTYLEQSPAFSVSLTRENDKFLAFADRCKAAYDNDADLFLSIHFNYDPVKILTGASAYIAQFDRYRLNGLADSILDSLSRLGLNNIGTLVRLDTADDGDAPAWWDLYDNTRTDEVDTGVYCDYYAMVNGPCKIFAYPVLIEHLHLSSNNDMALIQNSDGLAALARADAEAILTYFRCSNTESVDDLKSQLQKLYLSISNGFCDEQSFMQSIEKTFSSETHLSNSENFYNLIRRCFFR